MLERTAGCLESGSLRRLAASRKTIKSRRSLHSTFWNHGAIDTELSPLWTALVQGSDPNENSCDAHKSFNGGGLFLDFLYPAGTINFFRHISSWGVDRQDGRRSRVGFRRLGQRQYTSAAQDAVEEAGVDHAIMVGARQSVNSKLRIQAMQNLAKKGGDVDFNNYWHQYLLLDELDQDLVRQEVIASLAESERIINVERLIEVFRHMETSKRDPNSCRHAIRSYLRLQNLADALDVYAYTRANMGCIIEADSLLTYMIERGLWRQFFKTLTEINGFESQPGQQEPDNYIWQKVDELPNLPTKILEMVGYIEERIVSEKMAKSDIVNLIHHGVSMVERILYSGKLKSHLISQFLDILRKWEADAPIIYNTTIQRLIDADMVAVAIQVYRRERKNSRTQFFSSTLHSLLKLLCDNLHVSGMQEVLEDLSAHGSKPTKLALHMCMTAFAKLCDADAVHALFDSLKDLPDFDGKHRPLNIENVTPILLVHARRGELNEVKRHFDQLQDKYGVKPNLHCWNILIMAHGMAQDYDGALEAFQSVMDAEDIRPDQYTFSAIMRAFVGMGDLEGTINAYQLAEKMGIQKSARMLDCLAMAFIQDERLGQAEKLCNDAVKMDLIGSRTSMWNRLLTAYALAGDLENVNRVRQSMRDLGVEHDKYTLSALMMALCVVRQPDNAWSILKNAMPEAGIRPDNFHYAIVMGGFVATQEWWKVFRAQDHMSKHNIPDSASTTLQKLKATHIQSRRYLQDASPEDQFKNTYELFDEILKSMNAQHITATPQKGVHGETPMVAYPTMFYSYIAYVMAQMNQPAAVEKLYKRFIEDLPEPKKIIPPTPILSALMHARSSQGAYDGVEECWNLALAQARAQVNACIPVASSDLKNMSKQNLLPSHRLQLATILNQYMVSLQKQGRASFLPSLITSLQKEGFVLSNVNYNYYIQILARNYQYTLAFELCEKHLMPNWQGWSRLRWVDASTRRRLDKGLRYKSKGRGNGVWYTPKFHTLLYLARGYLELQEAAVESREFRFVLRDLEINCPRTIGAVRTMRKSEHELERLVLSGE
ncbi:hypothetical protein B0O99DRAFT_579962 [Bisporella sp. PMI_857]|nr:hypothetical protein B0O99DRAFT_579962 [Bisporella sp. PMI_857]